MIIETQRLKLIPLTAAQLKSWLYELPALEKELGCCYNAELMTGDFKEIVAGQLAATEADPDNYIWHSFWFIIRAEDDIVVGSADFKNAPDENGEVEIGYGLGDDYRHLGYMTETVRAMCGWALSQTGVNAVIAETELDGVDSQRVLKRCGFKEYKRGETIWWRIEPPEQSIPDISKPTEDELNAELEKGYADYINGRVSDAVEYFKKFKYKSDK